MKQKIVQLCCAAALIVSYVRTRADTGRNRFESGPPARNRDQLKAKTISHLRMLQKSPRWTSSYFKHPKIQYAA